MNNMSEACNMCNVKGSPETEGAPETETMADLNSVARSEGAGT